MGHPHPHVSLREENLGSNKWSKLPSGACRFVNADVICRENGLRALLAGDVKAMVQKKSGECGVFSSQRSVRNPRRALTANVGGEDNSHSSLSCHQAPPSVGSRSGPFPPDVPMP